MITMLITYVLNIALAATPTPEIVEIGVYSTNPDPLPAVTRIRADEPFIVYAQQRTSEPLTCVSDPPSGVRCDYTAQHWRQLGLTIFVRSRQCHPVRLQLHSVVGALTTERTVFAPPRSRQCVYLPLIGAP